MKAKTPMTTILMDFIPQPILSCYITYQPKQAMKNPLENILSQQSSDIIHQALEKYVDNQQPIDDFLHQLLTDSNAYTSEAEIKQTVAQISATIDAISLVYSDIQRYKSRGLSLNIWLQLEKPRFVLLNHERRLKRHCIHRQFNPQCLANFGDSIKARITVF